MKVIMPPRQTGLPKEEAQRQFRFPPRQTGLPKKEETRGKFPTNPLGWKHPGRAGWPLNYDKQGYFCLEDPETGKRFAPLWDPVTETWQTGFGQISPKEASRFLYLGRASIVYNRSED